jgi:hypothetical protein
LLECAILAATSCVGFVLLGCVEDLERGRKNGLTLKLPNVVASADNAERDICGRAHTMGDMFNEETGL